MKEKLEEDKEKLMEEWNKEWETLPKSQNKHYDKYFPELFKDNYAYVKYKAETNKFKNFLWKCLFLLILVIGIAILFREAANYLIIEENKLIITGMGAIYLLAFFLFAFVILKWMDIKKYQETWARHSRHKYLLEQEMLKFIMNIGEYAVADKKEVFIAAVIKIWEGNQKKFTDNMTNKEKALGINCFGNK